MTEWQHSSADAMARACCWALALAATVAGCREAGSAARGEMLVTLEPRLVEPLEASGASLELTRALLHVESVEVLGGEATTMHSHDESGHSHGDDAEAGGGGRLEVRTAPVSVDLLGEEVTLVDDPTAAAGSYTQVFVSVGPAEGGEMAGSTLLLEGTAESDGVVRTFVIRWDEEVDDLAMFEGDIDLEDGGQTEVPLTLDVGALLSGLDLFTAVAEEGRVTVDGASNGGLLGLVRTNLGAAFGLEHDSEHEHGHD